MLRISELSDQLSSFNPGDHVRINWVFDDYVAVRDRESYPSRGVIASKTNRGLFVRSHAGYLSMVGIYDLATGTSLEVIS